MRKVESRERHSAALPFDRAAFVPLDRVALQDRRIVAAGRRDEAIGEAQQDVVGGGSVQIDRNTSTLMQHHRAQIVDPVGLIGVLVGEEHRIDMIDLGVDQLLA